ncbi:hypothetical protein RJ640_020745 [Escallonia rubra]|uniref:DUF241 domain protein n=1 Tax=Escallonia rubra TaxID=112253 RepID=A0AA88S3U2_9ASTE|nr:hypothetical protein RJ640_020745 [Escallonia rubra]
MASSLSIPKSACHARSNSFPARSHPLTSSVEDHLFSLKASEATSSSPSSIFHQLNSLKDLHECVCDWIHLPSVQQTLSNEKHRADKFLDGSLRLLDICSGARDVLLQTNESIQEFESSLRRKRGEAGLPCEIGAYLTSRKKLNRIASKCIKNFKTYEKCPAVLLDNDRDLVAIVNVVREVETISFLVLKSVFSYVSGTKTISKQRGRSLVSKFMQPKREGIDSEAVQNLLKELQTFGYVIQKLENRLESTFRCLVKTRVSLLNALTN